MNRKRWIAGAVALVLAAALTGCSSEGTVYVQSVKSLAALGGIAPGDKFTGIVTSEDAVKIEKDSDKTVKELYVKEGDDVKEGDKLFAYDTEELQLTLDKQKLEQQQLESSITSYESQIETLQKSLDTVGGSTKLQYTIEIQSTQVDLKEAQIKLKTKQSEVQKSEELLANAEVTSPVDGRIQSVNDSGGTDNNGNALPYISIQKTGVLRVKGLLGELQRGGIQEGDRVTILSRTDSSTWSGTVTLVDYENPSQGSNMDQYYSTSSDEMTSSSRYPFYVDLDDTQGLLLGQHVYLELESEEEAPQGLNISSAFIAYNEDGTAFVWAEKNGKLVKRTVELGEYNAMNDTQQILSGITEEDYIAYPDENTCTEGASTTREAPAAEDTQAAEGA